MKRPAARTGRRRAVVLATTGVLGAALLSGAPADAVDAVNTTVLRDAVTVNGILGHERVLDTIAAQNGGTRASGTPGYRASERYVADTLRDAGYTVTRQPFSFLFFEETAPSELTRLGATPVDYESATFDLSTSGDVTGQLVPTTDVVIPPASTPSSSSGCEATDFPAPPSPTAVALIQRGTCTFEDKASNAAAAGYAAAIIFNEGQPGRRELLTGTLGNPSTIPVLGLAYADGRSLFQATRRGAVTVRVATSTIAERRTTSNIIADSPEGKQRGQTVLVGAHLDSVAAGPGINDNGSGSATILEIAEQMAALGYTDRLQRRVRFAFWGAEELGLVGSQHYVDGLSPAERNAIYANLNFDMLGSPNYVRFVYDGDGSATGLAGPQGSAQIERIFTDYFDSQGLASAPTEFNGRSDYGPFIDVGIPAGGLFSGAEGVKTAAEARTYGGTAGAPYDACYHQACDDLANLNTTALFELGDAAAHAVGVLTRSRTGLYPDGSLVGRTPAKAPASAATHRGHARLR